MSKTKLQCAWCEQKTVEYDADFCSKECARAAGEEMRLAFLELEIQKMFERELLGSVVGQKH